VAAPPGPSRPELRALRQAAVDQSSEGATGGVGASHPGVGVAAINIARIVAWLEERPTGHDPDLSKAEKLICKVLSSSTRG